MRHTRLFVALCIGVTAGVVAIGVHGAVGAPAAKMLGQVIAERHGHAAGDFRCTPDGSARGWTWKPTVSTTAERSRPVALLSARAPR